MTMARPKKIKDEVDENGGVVKPIDAERAMRIITNDILPERSEVGAHNQLLSTAMKTITGECNIPSWVVNLVVKLKGTEDFKRDHELRAFNLLMTQAGLGMIRADMVDMAEGKGDTPVVPIVARPTMNLVVANPPKRPVPEVSDGVDADLADGADDIDDGPDGHEADGDAVEDGFAEAAE
jgi:hypothetical protein